MGLREKLNENSRLTAGIVGTAALIATVFVVMQVMAGRRTVPSKLPDSFFSDDDGKSFFVYDSENVPPFDHKGKSAVFARVFQCCGKRYVGYLERYSTQAHALKVAGKGTRETEMYGRELKRPGETTWVSARDLAAANKIADVKCPHGTNASPEPVEP
ncbi:hypothetical protein BH09PLA1_BH09PLA1_10040 [soil metagenome]